MDHYEIYGLKYVPVAVKTADFADFCKKYNVVQDGAMLSGDTVKTISSIIKALWQT